MFKRICDALFALFRNGEVSSVADVYAPVLCVSKFGIVNTVKRNKKKNGYELSVLRFVFLLAIIVVTFLHLFIIPGTILYLEKKVRGMNVTSYKFKLFRKPSQHFITKLVNPLSVATTTAIFRILVLCRMHRTVPKLIEKFQAIDQQLGYFQDSHKRDHRYLICMVFILILITFPFETYSLFYTFKGELIPTLLFGINNYNNFSLCCVEFQFFSFCFLVFFRFRSINAKLSSLEINLKTLHLCKYKKMEILVCHQEAKLKKEKVLDEVRICDEICDLRRIHKSLVDLLREINASYDLQLLLAVCCGGINVLLNLYYSIFGGFEMPATSDFVPRQPYDVLNDIVWASYYFIRFVFICFISHKVVQEGHGTRLVVANLFHRFWPKNVQMELWNFHNHLSCNRIEISACGFFVFNLKLITAAIATGTTYLVILAQFHKG